MDNIPECNWGSHTDKKREAIPRLSWVSHWNRELLVARIRAEIDCRMGIVKRAEVKNKLKKMKEKEKKEKDKKEKGRNPKKENTLLRIRLLKNKLNPMMMKEAGLPSTEGHYDSSETLVLEEESVSDSVQQKMIIVRMDIHSQSEPLDIVPIQVCMPPSTLQPQQPAESTSTVPPAPSKILDFTDSSQEETLTQEGRPGYEKEKSPETLILIEELEELGEQLQILGLQQR
ncbi:hypothetical protein Ahy_A03g010626 isoform A [Arachis hypogaea]|uniref:Uncharacterized protein n=1 Tax=Arachis hypogaea TaxID=3818 RepID=A0A445DMY8_ARAHY|nr:hypothetical protein Ahy_A03g010626 isoform A [Arachis hypogaea]